MVVSSDTPTSFLLIRVQRVGSTLRPSRIRRRTILNSWLSVESGLGRVPSLAKAASALTPSWIRRVASPPSSTSRSAPSPSGQIRAFSVHHQYSSRVSPFQANTAAESRAMTAAAWSWVEKMLHEHQRTSAPRAVRVSIRTAVWTVMCSEPAMRAPLKGWAGPNSLLRGRKERGRTLGTAPPDDDRAARGTRFLTGTTSGRASQPRPSPAPCGRSRTC